MARPVHVAALTFALLAAPAWSGEGISVAERKQLVNGFVAAFNQQDSAAMARLVTDDVEWLAVDGTTISAETRGKPQLVSSMDAYFKSCPSCRSEIRGIVATPRRASAVEVASWETPKGKRSQRGVAVYEFSGALIRRVYYFPAEP